MNNPSELLKWLHDNEWLERKVHAHESFSRAWYKKFPKLTRCKLNPNRDKSIEIRLWIHEGTVEHPHVFGIDLQFVGLPEDNGPWISFNVYAITSIDQINKAIDMISTAWEALCK